MFSCLNRMDKYPGIFTQSLYKEEPFKLNKDFTFNSSGILCNVDNLVPWTQRGIDFLRNTPSCQTKTRKKVGGNSLWELLLRDMGFRERKHIPERNFKKM